MGAGLLKNSGVMHWKLSDTIVVAELSVPSEFYRMHALYLWLTTAEWLIGLVGVILSVRETTVLRVHYEIDYKGNAS